MKKTLIAACLAACIAGPLRAQELSVVPRPAHMEAGEGFFQFKGKTRFAVPAYEGDSVKQVFARFEKNFETATGVELLPTAQTGRADIRLRLATDLGPEAYRLRVTPHDISIEASRPAGFFYALQTLQQLMPRNVLAGQRDNRYPVWKVPAVSIEDAPRFGWRGFMLDEGRHFFGMEAVKAVLDMMATYKMNRFHWHLTEDQGWRLEIKSAPKLTSVGAWRNSKRLAWGNVKTDGLRYGGYYTQEQAREIVRYARERFIEIIPEIDIPGHSQAAVAAYPEWLACDPDQPHEVWLSQGVSTDVINVAKPEARRLARNIIDELITIFPFRYIHLGGDECPTVKWEKNAECQALLKKIGSKNYRDLQLNFYEDLQAHIASKPAGEQRQLVFWNEVLHGNTAGLGKDITIMAWVGADRAARQAAEAGMNTILSPQIPYYINRRQAKGPFEPRTQGNGSETVEAVYTYVPAAGIQEALQPRYLGVQANFWSEWVETADCLQYLMLPRLAAVAEAGWTPQAQRNYSDFVKRMQGEPAFYQMMGWSYGPHIFQ